jgi:hypothetical protein
MILKMNFNFNFKDMPGAAGASIRVSQMRMIGITRGNLGLNGVRGAVSAANGGALSYCAVICRRGKLDCFPLHRVL